MARPQKSRKNLLDSFGERYNIIEHDGGYLLYDKEGYSKRSNALYLGYFFISTDGARFKFEDDYYQTASELIEAITEYNKTLPFDADIYNPMYRKNARIEMALHDYIESLGFKMSWKRDSSYCLKDPFEQCICDISFNVEQDSTVGLVQRNIPNTYRWTEAKFTDLESAIGAVNSILAMYCLSINAITMNVLNALTESRAAQVLDITCDFKKLSTYTEDAKQKTIEHLERELKKMKGETNGKETHLKRP